MLVLILKCGAVRQANGHQLGISWQLGFFREEGPVKLHEGDVIVASIQQLWLVSLVNYNLFNSPKNR